MMESKQVKKKETFYDSFVSEILVNTDQIL